MADLKSTFTLGHSTMVAHATESTARAMGVDHCLDAAANGKGARPPALVNEFKAISRYL